MLVEELYSKLINSDIGMSSAFDSLLIVLMEQFLNLVLLLTRSINVEYGISEILLHLYIDKFFFSKMFFITQIL